MHKHSKNEFSSYVFKLFQKFSITVFPSRARARMPMIAQFYTVLSSRGNFSLADVTRGGTSAYSTFEVHIINAARNKHRWQDNPSYPLPPRGRRPGRWTRGNSSNGDVGTGAGTRADPARRPRPPPAWRAALFCTARAGFSPGREYDCKRPRRPPLPRPPWNRERPVKICDRIGGAAVVRSRNRGFIRLTNLFLAL